MSQERLNYSRRGHSDLCCLQMPVGQLKSASSMRPSVPTGGRWAFDKVFELASACSAVSRLLTNSILKNTGSRL